MLPGMAVQLLLMLALLLLTLLLLLLLPLPPPPRHSWQAYRLLPPSLPRRP